MSSKINPPSSGGENDAFIVYDSRPGVPRTGILDFSWMNDAPAGSHGAVLVRNGGFVFEDGTPVKFFGVNIGFAAAAPDKPVAEAMAAELASCGVNFVRLHALDSTYMGLIDYTKETTQSISKDVLDKLDYFVYCLKQKGIYIHLDTSVIRIYKEGDGFSKEKADIFLNTNGYLMSTHFHDERVMELDLAFALELITHVNPYTGMSYAEDPVVAVIQFANESSITWYATPNVQNVFTRELNQKFNTWLRSKYKTRAALDAAWTDADGTKALEEGEDPALGTVKSPALGGWGEQLVAYDYVGQQPRRADWITFLIETQTATFHAFYDALRDLGYKSAINCSNQAERGADIYLNAQGDVMEKNAYLNLPDGPEMSAVYSTHEMASLDIRKADADISLRNHSLQVLSRAQVADKPFIVTEWNVTNPAVFKADALLQMASYGAFQDWDGFCVFLYVFSAKESGFFTTKEMGSVFEIVNQPAMYGQFGMAAMLFRYGYVQPARNEVEVGLTYDDLLAPNADFYKAPAFVPFVSKFSYRLIEDGVYEGGADLVIPSGNVSGGDYTKANRLMMLSENPFSDAFNKRRGRDLWYAAHAETKADKLSVGGLTFRLGARTAIAENAGEAGGFYTNANFYDALTQVMRSFGLISAEQGYFDDRVISDTGELTYVFNQSFRLDAPSAAIFAGRTDTDGGGNPVGGGSLMTRNDRAAVAVLSMAGDKPLREADKLLIYAMGRNVNSSMILDGNTMKFLGVEPVLYEDIRGDLTLLSDKSRCRVWGLDTLGNRVAEIEVRAKEGGFVLSLGGYFNYEAELGD